MLKTRRRSHVSGSVRPSLFTPASRLQKDSGWNCKSHHRACVSAGCEHLIALPHSQFGFGRGDRHRSPVLGFGKGHKTLTAWWRGQAGEGK